MLIFQGSPAGGISENRKITNAANQQDNPRSPTAEPYLVSHQLAGDREAAFVARAHFRHRLCVSLVLKFIATIGDRFLKKLS
jgi:hypothetical protein